MGDIAKAVKLIVDIANDNTHGYDQTHRYGPDYDCSSLVAKVLHDAGFDVDPKSWTGNLEKQLLACGFVKCTKPWKAGDIHLKIGKHVCMSINANQIAHASINENGKTTGGKKGDQTGKEIYVRDYYEYSGGWSTHLRYVGTKATKKTNEEIAKEVIRGKWGHGAERKEKLTKAGYNYDSVQAIVNKIIKEENDKKNNKLANEFVTRLKETGANWNEVKKIVDKAI